MLPRDDFGFQRVRPVSRSHDLDAELIEDVQDLPMQFRVEPGHLQGIIGIDIEFIEHGKVSQLLLQNKRRRGFRPSRSSRYAAVK